jgi:hypothetical protein
MRIDGRLTHLEGDGSSRRLFETSHASVPLGAIGGMCFVDYRSKSVIGVMPSHSYLLMAPSATLIRHQ